MNDNLKEGAFVKIFLKGESPWGIVQEIKDDLVNIEVNNILFHEMPEIHQARFMKDNFGTVEKMPKLHDYKCGDKIWCKPLGRGFEPNI